MLQLTDHSMPVTMCATPAAAKSPPEVLFLTLHASNANIGMCPLPNSLNLAVSDRLFPKRREKPTIISAPPHAIGSKQNGQRSPVCIIWRAGSGDTDVALFFYDVSRSLQRYFLSKIEKGDRNSHWPAPRDISNTC